MKKRRAQAKLYSPQVLALRWDDEGQCFDVRDSKEGIRQPDCDFGTVKGDMFIDPWMQDIIMSKQRDSQ